VSGERESRSLLFEQREARLAALDALPRALWLGSMINSQGALEPRLGALHALRAALLAARLPDPDSACWPDRDLAAGLHAICVQLDLPRLCHDYPDIVDQVVGSMLWHLDRIVDYVDRGDDADAAGGKALQGFAEEWQERQGLVEKLVEVFGAAGDLLKNVNWDQLRGLLASEGWQSIVRIRSLIATLPELSALLARLGRTRPADDADASSALDEQAEDESTAVRTRTRITHIPEMPGATRGVCRSGRIARMLPSETMLLTHPHLRFVWHARRAERSLLTYEEDERMREIVQEPAPVSRSLPRRGPNRRREAGPMLICVDTSGSMQGGAELVAKAVVLEAMRTAHAQKRACRVFAFGGPDEIEELELDLDVAGLETLADFLGRGFRGGTDICGPLERVLARLGDERWQLADLLIASDGEFGATPATAEQTRRAKTELGLRVQGVLIGDRETIGMLELADDVFWVRDWRRYGGLDVDSPVPTKSLTAIYFPGALRPGKPGATVAGDAAARTVVPRGHEPPE
jgi:uncharacterized protein with von Willebrand factor type A (vWA) domain